MICENFAYGGLMKYFEEISAIPRPTFHEDKIADYICSFAQVRGLECYRDELNNVFIRLEGSKGRREEPAILLQGHTDMVCEKNESIEHDFLTDGIKLCENNGWLRARGTTLGADNGVAVAVMLYILDGAEGHLPKHPPIECLFTASEEVGLSGAQGFDYSKIKAQKMINLDSADEGQIIAGCAGGQRITLALECNTDVPVGEAVVLTLKGLAGGHSGEDIHRGRANANKLMGRVLLALASSFDFRLSSVNGGSKDNAIPREATAVLVTNKAREMAGALSQISEEIKNELCADDSAFEIKLSPCEMPKTVFDEKATEKIIFMSATVPNGVFQMNTHIEGLVEFSRNLGIVATSDNHVEFTFAARSPKASQLRVSNQELEAYAKILGMTVEYGAGYPGWEYAETSQIREAYAEVYKELYGHEPEVTIIHAGLECGIIKEKLPYMDIISCGPMVVNLHSPDEAMNIASFERFFTVVKNTLAK